MAKVSLTINGKKVEAETGTMLLKAAKDAGFGIPTLCSNDGLEPYGACRLCMVEVENHGRKKMVAACCYPVAEGIIVTTENEEIHRIRKMICELLLASSPVGAHAMLAKRYKIEKSRFKRPDTKDTHCTLCGLCVRWCAEKVKKEAVTYTGRGVNRKVVLVPGDSDQCKSCRQCFHVCDAGRIVRVIDFGDE